MASDRRKRVNDALEALVNRLMRRMELRIYQSLTFATPVDLGFARAGWIPSVGAPGKGAELPPAGSSDEAISALSGALLSTRSQSARAIATGYQFRAGPIFIVNNVRYIQKLNQGSSAQAPANFVETGIKEGLIRAALEIRR